MNILIKEMLAFYDAFDKGIDHSLPPLRVQYKDYVAWMDQQLVGDSLQYHRKYWENQFQGEIPVLNLPADKERPAIRTFNGGIIREVIDQVPAKELKSICQAQGATLFMGLIAILNALFYKYTGQDDIIIGTPIAGREHPDLENQVGLYLNTLAIRTRFDREDSFLELLQRVKTTALEAFEHQVYPFELLVGEMPLKRDPGRNPLFDVMLTLHNTDMNIIQAANVGEELKVERYEMGDDTHSKLDLIFNFVEMEDGLQSVMEYNKDVLSKKNVEDIFRQMRTLANCIAVRPEIKLAEMKEYLDSTEREARKEHLQKVRMNNLMNLKSKN
jgi:non-ribosomal peptide synthetase component F